MDNMTMFIISHVIRLWRHKIDKNGEIQYGRVHAIVNIFLGRALYSCSFLYEVPFCISIKNYIDKNIKQFSDSSRIEIKSE